MSRTVLIVDDSDMVLRLVGFTLKKAGFSVLTSSDGNEAQVHFNGQNIDLVITDLHMPNKDGLQLIQDIRAMADYRFLPIMLFVSNTPTDIQEFIRTSKATLLFNKDSINDKLVSTVKKIVN